MKKSIVYITVASFAIAGCATSPKDITANYTSPIQYQNYDCDQIIAENQRLRARVSELGGRLDEAASNDKAITGVGIILFWPALFALGGTKQQEAEYARLKGEHEALQQAAIIKKCGLPTESKGAAAATPTAAMAAQPAATEAKQPKSGEQPATTQDQQHPPSPPASEPVSTDLQEKGDMK